MFARGHQPPGYVGFDPNYSRTMSLSSKRDLMPLINAARRGRRGAQGRLFAALLPDLRCYVRLNGGRHLRARESLSDLTQSVCREALGDLREFRGGSEAAFRTWLFRIAANKVRGRQRYWLAEKRDAARERLPGEAEVLLRGYASLCTPSQDAVAHEEVARIEAAFDRLPPDYRTVIELACYVGLSHADIAHQTASEEATVRQLLCRARARLGLLLALPAAMSATPKSLT